MSDIEGDVDLARAIALSLQESIPDSATNRAEIINLTSSEDEDDDLDAPVTVKKTKLAIFPGQTGVDKTVRDVVPIDKQSPRLQPSTSSLLGLDRKQMEEARLHRMKQRSTMAEIPEGANDSRKRKPSISLSRRDVKGKHWNTQLGDDTDQTESSIRDVTGMTPERKESKVKDGLNHEDSLGFKREPATIEGQGPLGIQFPAGVVRKTWVLGHPRQDDIKIEEVFQKDDLELAVLSSFQIDPDWVTSKLNPNTKVVWCLQAKNEAEVS